MSQDTTSAEEEETAIGQEHGQHGAPKPSPPPAKTYTQAELDRVVSAARREAREDYEQVKAEAARVEELTQRIEAIERESRDIAARELKYSIASQYGISREDSDLFLTAIDPDLIEQQARRLSGMSSSRRPVSNVAPREGTTTARGNSAAEDMRRFASQLIGRDTSLI